MDVPDQARTKYLSLACLFLLLVVSACQPSSPSVPASTATPFSLAKIELFRNQLKWKVANVSHYRFQIFQGCICEDNEEVLVEVEDGQIVSVEYQNGRDMNPDYRAYFENWGTMERLFLTVEDELNSDSLKVTVKYDSTFGFPIDIFSERSQGSDDELYLTISGFEAVP